MYIHITEANLRRVIFRIVQPAWESPRSASAIPIKIYCNTRTSVNGSFSAFVSMMFFFLVSLHSFILFPPFLSERRDVLLFACFCFCLFFCYFFLLYFFVIFFFVIVLLAPELEWSYIKAAKLFL